MFIEEMYKKHLKMQLLEAIKIDPNEDLTDTLVSCINGKMTVYHNAYAKMHRSGEVTSVFTDFKVISIYNSKPSEYDQQLYINVMSKIFKNQNYKEKARRALKKEKEDEDGGIESV